MEQFDYQEMLDITKELIQETGRKVTFQNYGSQPADPARPNLGSTPVVLNEVADVWATFLSTKSVESQWGLNFLSDDFVKKFTNMALVAGRAEDLSRYDTIVDFDGTVYRIGEAQVLRPSTLILLYGFGLAQ